LLLLELCFRDARMVTVTYRSEEKQRELIVTLVYLPYNSDEPPTIKEMDIIDYCTSWGK
jgi:hypothetical protein